MDEGYHRLFHSLLCFGTKLMQSLEWAGVRIHKSFECTGDLIIAMESVTLPCIVVKLFACRPSLCQRN